MSHEHRSEPDADEGLSAEPAARESDARDAHDAAEDDDTGRLDALAASLLWRIGRAYDDGPVTVRVGLASAAPLFAELPRLRAASDQEVEAALASGDVTVEWVGPRVSGGRG